MWIGLTDNRSIVIMRRRRSQIDRVGSNIGCGFSLSSGLWIDGDRRSSLNGGLTSDIGRGRSLSSGLRIDNDCGGSLSGRLRRDIDRGTGLNSALGSIRHRRNGLSSLLRTRRC